MKTLLLTRKSAFQVYCANSLYKENILTDVILEEGSSFAPTFKKTWRRKVSQIAKYSLKPTILFYKILNTINYNKYFGNQEFYNQRILESDYNEFLSGLNACRTENINNDKSLNLIQNINPDFIFIFGTRMIKKHIIDSIKYPMVNMHWGWSPDYRGEGIITALAYKGTKDLGITIHHLDLTSDGGDIIYQKRPSVDKEDNFYSIGLKLAKLGTYLFIKAFKEFKNSGSLARIKQELSKGKLYSSSFVRDHPELLSAAWESLKRDVNK